MKQTNNYLYSKKTQTLQLRYSDYKALMEKVAEAKRVMHVKNTVLAELRQAFGAGADAGKESKTKSPSKPVETKKTEPAREPVAEKAPAEISADVKTSKKSEAPAAVDRKPPMRDVPPIKKDIAQHFNDMDGSGRLFNVFKQYYTCLNDTCGGTVRVTLKDGFCSLWNYDAWEEFAFIDIFDAKLRIAIDPRFTDELKSLDLCEVPRLLSSRRNLICVAVDDLNTRMLEVLARAFDEVGRKQEI